MEMLEFVIPILVIIALVWVTVAALKNLGQFGSANELKKESLFRVLFNFVSIIVLLIIVYAKEKNIINETYFYTVFTGIVVSLGIKMTTDFKK